MRRFIFGMMLLGAASVSAQHEPLWMRYPAISPDGQQIAFAYKGDIFCVDAKGGKARQITTNPAHDSYPVWSPDGKRIAFASNREGGFDIYVTNADGGAPKRLTTNSGGEIPVAWKDNDHILFQASGMPSAESIIFAGSFQQVYEVDTDGRRPTMFSTLPMENISFNAHGDILYHDNKGYEDKWRKHHTSPITRDIWMKRGDKFTKMTTFEGEDRNPVWAADGQSFYYLSEMDGTFNVYKKAANGGNAQQLTHFKGNPVRFLTAADNGTLCFGYNGEIYTLSGQGEPKKVSVDIVADRNDKELMRQITGYGASEMAVSPNGKEVAFIMHGDVYVTSTEYKTTKRITDTPEQERSVDFAPDGRSVVYCSERGGVWQIYQSTIKNKDEKLLSYATELEEERLTNTNATSLQPKYSPDGKKVAFFEDRCTLRVINLKNKDVTTALDGKYNYSYSDGDLWFDWSPDSRWLLACYQGNGGWNNSDIALVDASGKKEPVNLTNSGYNEGSARWALGGKAMLFQSDRAGYRSHGSWGAEDDIYIMFFDLDAYDHFRMTKEEQEIADKNDKEKKKEEEKKEKAEEKKKDDETVEVEKVKALELDTDNCRDRILRLTNNSSRLGDAILSNDGNKLYYQTAFEAGYDLWVKDLKEGSTRILVKDAGYGDIMTDKDANDIYMCGRGGMKKITLASGSTKSISFEAWFNMKPYEERQYLFDHAWRQVKDKFYDTNLHGVDWEGMKQNYAKFLPYINNNFDFAEMLSEMLGELNASHTGARYYASGASLQTASLGLFLDDSWTKDGLKVKEVIKRGPFALKNTGVKAGDIIESIDGVKITAGMDYNPLLDGKAGKPVRIGIKGKKDEIVIKPISLGTLNKLLYKRWVDRNRAFVDSISGGTVAYVHVKAMDSESFRKVYEELLSESNRNRKAVVVDERHNGGGWLHDDLCTLLSGKEYQNFVPQGKYIGRDPFNKWTKPSCVLICEDDYSNGHGFPWVYKELGIGKLVGTPVAGTMTAVWWETLMDRSLVFGIPQVGCRDMRGVYGENNTLHPDIEVYNTPEDFICGYDRQLERAVRLMMEE